MSRKLLFLCPHAAAKSVIAAAYASQLADKYDLDVRIDASGTEPDEQVSPAVVALLAAEGIDVSGHQPRRVTDDELAAADRIISLGCSLDGRVQDGMAVEYWDDVPP